jgi:predicted ester cyclase
MASREENKNLYRRWLLELWNGDVGIAREIVAPGILIHYGGIKTENFRGPEGVVKLVRMSRSPFSELRFTIEAGPIAEGEIVAARWTGRGIYEGGMPGATAPAGTRVKFSGTDLLRIESKKFVEYWVSSDSLHLMQQLGAVAAE